MQSTSNNLERQIQTGDCDRQTQIESERKGARGEGGEGRSRKVERTSFKQPPSLSLNFGLRRWLMRVAGTGATLLAETLVNLLEPDVENTLPRALFAEAWDLCQFKLL